MKGPMTTQSLIGLESMTPFHWRGDRVDLGAFNPAFDKLLGGAEIAAADMTAYTSFIDSVPYPPNPNQNRDRTYPSAGGTSAANGFNRFANIAFTGGVKCVDCHSLFTGSNNAVIPAAVLQEPQAFKVPQLRNIYKRDGRKNTAGQRTAGFGQLHDGSEDDVFDLLTNPVFGNLSTNTNNKLSLQNFVEAFDTGMAPAVGLSRTIDPTNYQQVAVVADKNLLITQAQAANCDLIARGAIDGEPAGLFFNTSNQLWQRDRVALANLTTAQLDLLFQQGQATLTLIGVPLGQGERIGIDRDDDGTRDGDEGIESYGSATPGCSLTLRANSPAFIGNDQFGVVTEGATPGNTGAVFLAFGSASIPFFGIDILVDPGTLIPVSLVADANGTAQLPLPLPDNPAMQGLTLFLQSIFLDGCGSQGIGASAGLSAVIN